MYTRTTCAVIVGLFLLQPVMSEAGWWSFRKLTMAGWNGATSTASDDEYSDGGDTGDRGSVTRTMPLDRSVDSSSEVDTDGGDTEQTGEHSDDGNTSDESADDEDTGDGKVIAQKIDEPPAGEPSGEQSPVPGNDATGQNADSAEMVGGIFARIQALEFKAKCVLGIGAAAVAAKLGHYGYNRWFKAYETKVQEVV